MSTRVLALAFLAAVACSKESSAPVEQAAPAPAQPVETIADEGHRPNRPDIGEAEARALVSAWLEAQNAGDFDAYAATYAKRITGIKRVGDKTSTFDRDGWLADRKRMFRKPMRVQTEAVVVRTSPTSAVVRFQQTWSSASFKDVGEKQLIVVREDSALRIAREEMLSSDVLKSKHGAPMGLDDLIFGVPEIAGFVVTRAQADWAVGPIDLQGADPSIATRKADPRSIPEPWTNLIGSTLTVYSGENACTDTITALDIVVGVTPHFMFFQDEDGNPVDRNDDDAAQSIFAMGTPYLVARTRGDCQGGVAHLGARARALGKVTRVDDAAIKTQVVAAFRSSKNYGALQKDFEAYGREGHDDKARWSDAEQVAVFAANGTQLAVVGAKGGDGCGEFSGALTVLYEIGENGKLTEVGALNSLFSVNQALDLGADGRIELLGTTDNYGSDEVTFVGSPGKREPYGSLHHFAWDYHDCPC